MKKNCIFAATMDDITNVQVAEQGQLVLRTEGLIKR